MQITISGTDAFAVAFGCIGGGNYVLAHRNVTVYLPPETTETADGQVEKKVLEAGAAAAVAAQQAEEEQNKLR